MLSRFFPSGLLLALASTLMFASCNKDNNSDQGNEGNGDNNTTANTVTIEGMAFSPASLTVKAGTTVTWTNNDNMPHTVTADNNSFTSKTLNKGDTYTHQFSAAGTYPYHCEVHPAMKATVVAN